MCLAILSTPSFISSGGREEVGELPLVGTHQKTLYTLARLVVSAGFWNSTTAFVGSTDFRRGSSSLTSGSGGLAATVPDWSIQSSPLQVKTSSLKPSQGDLRSAPSILTRRSFPVCASLAMCWTRRTSKVVPEAPFKSSKRCNSLRTPSSILLPAT